MTTRFRVREMIEEINASREKLGLPPVTDAAIARAAKLNRRTLTRLTNNADIGRELFDILDRLMGELSVIAGRPIGPGDIIVWEPQGASSSRRPARALPKRKGGRPRVRPADEG